MTTKSMSLAALEEPCPALNLPDGRQVAIRQIDGIGMQLLQAAQNGDPTLFWDAAVRCLPALTVDEVRNFTLSQVVRVIEIASGQAERVLAEIQRPTAPAETGTLPPTSLTPSAT